MQSGSDDILLLSLIREGDQLAFRRLFELHFTPLCRFMHVYLPDKGEVEELALDIFVYVWENRSMLQINISLKAYLFQSARNKCLNALRKRRNTVSISELDCDIVDVDVYSLEEEELQHLIQEAVVALPDKCREVFVMSRNENMSNQEISEKLDISTKTVEAQITKALKRIKQFLGDKYYYLW